ncbi:sigma-70 family RNA polymerase sigma factor [Gemmata sp. JC673]|uniref:Sigma-70 family RNA polymerase sigma factor n=1 Tax=Gemmata algarum TaxID=2975278 RepID=A0ABU5F0J3_9BACT|nr:sigma-70 family RNA polymerase sigma factor [Gemmata algarum]MDY3561093.1 sigma-70 family RNA polymerase sigma factor [Gemmata algarum]
MTDAELLDRFGRSRDEAAFAELVRRHGPVVYRICRRLVGPADADDAFQSTFLVLATRLRAARAAGALGGWLAGVAGRVARQMRRMAARRLRHEQAAGEERPIAWENRAADLEDQIRALDEELTRLPEELRGPVVLCLLQGYTQEQAAAELGRDPRTLRRRLDRAKGVLRARLERRGVVPAVAAALVSGGGGAVTAVPPDLNTRAVCLVCDFLAGGASPSSPPVALAKGVAATMSGRKLVWTMAMVALGAMGLGMGAAHSGPPGTTLTPPAPPVKELAKESEAKPTTSADEVTGLDWAKDEELAKRTVEALKRDPKAAPSVVIQSVCVRVPDGFCKRAGLTENSLVGPGGDCWQLNQREARMLKSLLATERNGSVVHRHQLVVADGKTASAESLRKLDVVTSVQTTTEGGAKVYTTKTRPVEVGLKLQFAPKFLPSGSASLDVKLTNTVVAGPRVEHFQGYLEILLDPANFHETSWMRENLHGRNLLVEMIDGGAVVVRTRHKGSLSKTTVNIGGIPLTELPEHNGSAYEVLLLLTADVVGPQDKITRPHPNALPASPPKMPSDPAGLGPPTNP